jgi:hypothetical protein
LPVALSYGQQHRAPRMLRPVVTCRSPLMTKVFVTVKPTAL